MVMCGRCVVTYHLAMICSHFRLDPLVNETGDPRHTVTYVHLAFPRLIIIIAHNDIDFGIRQLESLGLSLCLSRQCSG